MKWIIFVAALIAAQQSQAQSTNANSPRKWSEADRTYLVTELTRSRDELVKETTGLTDAQWNFKESPDRWSIAEIVDHIAIWELLMQREISQNLKSGPHPEFAEAGPTDSIVLGFITEQNKHYSNEYTKPFTFAQPTSHSGTSSLAWLLRMRNESIGFLGTTNDDLRALYLLKGRGNVHQIYITTFGHTDRHLRQIKGVKANKAFPK